MRDILWKAVPKVCKRDQNVECVNFYEKLVSIGF